VPGCRGSGAAGEEVEDGLLGGTPTKRQVSKRQVSKRPVSKRPKRQVYKTSGLQNVRFTKRQVFKMSGCKTSGFKTSLLVNISKRPFSRKTLT
jgi:hypothetical protein